MTISQDLGRIWTHMKEIPNAEFLVSVQHNITSANLEVFDVSRRGQAKKIYSFEEISGSIMMVKIILVIVYTCSDGKWRFDLQPTEKHPWGNSCWNRNSLSSLQFRYLEGWWSCWKTHPKIEMANPVCLSRE